MTHADCGDPNCPYRKEIHAARKLLGEAYGPWVGVPMFAFASFVGYERIDARNHDFSDVISGALIGIAIGHAVSQNHQTRILGMEILPFANPRTGAVGLALTRSW